MPRITVFNGGLRIAQAAHLIQQHESVAYVNANHIPGILTPMHDKLQSVAGASKYGHYFTTPGTWYWSATPKDWVEFQERLYIGNRSGTSTKIVGVTEYNLGIQLPTTVPTLAASLESPEQNQITRLDLTASTNAAADIPSDVTLSYKVVNKTAAGKCYPSDSRFTIRVKSNLDPAHADYDHNQIAVTCEDTNIDDTIAIFRFFDNYWRKIYEGTPAGVPTVIDDTYDISANDDDTGYEVTGLKGTYQYALTFFNSTDGTESAPVVSDELEIDWGTCTISNLQVATDPQVDQKKLYRVGGNLTTFSLVATITNATTSYVDSERDDEIDGTLLTAEDHFPPVANLKYLMESYAMLFAADGDKLRFTPIGEPDYWPQTYYLDFPKTITGLGKTPIGILVFTYYETYLVTGTGPLSLTPQLLTGSQGCINGDTVVNIEGASLWISTDGVCQSNGGVVGVISQDKLGKSGSQIYFDTSNCVNAVVYDERYHVLQIEQGTTLVLDLARQIIKLDNYGIDSLIVAEDTIYGYYDGNLYELDAHNDLLQMQYSSPKYIGRGYTVPKIYKNFYMFSEGIVTINIYIDDVLAQSKTFTTKDNHQIKIPKEHMRGFELQFHILGTGTVYEVQWDEGDANQ